MISRNRGITTRDGTVALGNLLTSLGGIVYPVSFKSGNKMAPKAVPTVCSTLHHPSELASIKRSFGIYTVLFVL
jgi:hypothetical protein